MSRTILGVSAAALSLGVSAVAIAQSGGNVRSNDRKIEKALDHEKLTPIRPIRRVGPDDWPMGDPDKRADSLNKPRETTGQAPADSKDAPKQDQAKQPPAEPPKQEQAKQDAPKPNQPPAQNNAQQQQPAAAQQPQQAQSGNQQNAQSQQSNTQPKQDNFASIRLGTDAQGRVALNEAQEKQILSALRKQRLRPAEASVKVGAVTPPDVRLGAVSADIVAVLPQFRGYSFFATRDEVVIVEPTDKRIVAVVPINGSQVASQPERERNTERTKESSERNTERTERSASRSSGSASRRESKRETTGAGIPSEEEILNAPVTGSSGRAQTRVEPDDGDTVVIERRPHRHRVFGIFRF